MRPAPPGNYVSGPPGSPSRAKRSDGQPAGPIPTTVRYRSNGTSISINVHASVMRRSNWKGRGQSIGLRRTRESPPQPKTTREVITKDYAACGADCLPVSVASIICLNSGAIVLSCLPFNLTRQHPIPTGRVDRERTRDRSDDRASARQHHRLRRRWKNGRLHRHRPATDRAGRPEWGRPDRIAM